MESSSDIKKKHKYFTRSKKKIKDETVKHLAKKSDMKNFNKNIKMVINKKVKTKAIFKKEDSDDYIPSSSDDTEDSELDEYGNIKGLIDYADQAMYKVKQAGGNDIILYED